MNKELDLLVIEYLKNKDKNTLTKIFNLLSDTLKKKASFVFYQQTFHVGKVIGYKIMKPDNKRVAMHEFHFKLCETNQADIHDIEQDLAVEVIRIIKNYNSSQPFYTYLISSLWKYAPKFIRKEKFFKYLKNKPMNIIDASGNEKSLIDDIPQENNFQKENFTDMFENLSEKEIKIINLYQENGNIRQSEIAEITGLTPSGVSFILKGLRKKCKNLGF